MDREIRIVDGPLADRHAGVAGSAGGETGAVVRFEGRVRGLEDGKPIDGLEYTAYRPMAESELAKILDEVAERFAVQRVTIEHATGRIAVGEISMIVTIHSAHRLAALDACAYLIERLKQSVPIWKKGYVAAG